MIPLFTSHYSIGKSILTLDHPDKQTEGGSTSVFSIAQKNNLKEIFLVENSVPVLVPPMIPPRPKTPDLSVIAHILF